MLIITHNIRHKKHAMHRWMRSVMIVTSDLFLILTFYEFNLKNQYRIRLNCTYTPFTIS